MSDSGDQIPSFLSFQVNPNEEVKLTVAEEEEITLTQVSILPNEKTPKEGRIVLYATPLDENNKKLESIAIAPLTIGKFEVAQIDFHLNCYQPIIFSTKGAEIPVVVNGSSEVTDAFKTETIKN